jgi:hypothetical protein
MLDIIREEFSPGYLCCLHCGADIAQMIKYVYGQYDQLLQQEALSPPIPPKPPIAPPKPPKQKNARTNNT